MDLFLLQKTNKEKDRWTKGENDLETLKDYEKEFAHWTFVEYQGQRPRYCGVHEGMENISTWNIRLPPEGKWDQTNAGQLCTSMEWSEHTRKSHPWSSFIMQPDRAKKVLETDFVSEGIMKTRLKYEHRNETIIQICTPCNNFLEEEKAEFFEKLCGTIDSVPDNDDLIVMGDFNGRVGLRRTPWETYLGPHSDTNTECNYNGEQLLALCAEHGRWITNTFYNHRPSQRQTW